MDYDHVIAYDRFGFVVVDMKSMLYYISARELWHEKGTLTPCVAHYNPASELYSNLLERILRSYYLVCFILNILSVAPPPHKHVRPT